MSTDDHVLSGFFAGAEGAQIVALMAALIKDAIGWNEVVADFGAKCWAMNSLQGDLQNPPCDGGHCRMVPMEALLVVSHVSWFCVCTHKLFFVLAGDINFVDCQHFWAGREKVNVLVEYGIAVVIIASSKLIGITVQLGWEIQFGVISGLVLVSLDMSKRRR